MQMSSIYSAIVIHREVLNNAIVTLTLKKPTGFAFTPGEYSIIPFAGRDVYMSLVTHPDTKLMRIAFRTSDSSLKKYLQSLQPGDALLLQEPEGHFTLGADTDVRPIIFLAGGIGVTPIRSLVAELSRRQHNAPYYLFQSCRMPDEALFREEFTELSHKTPAFTYIPVFTRLSSQTGRITAETINATHSVAADYYIAGPHDFVASMITLLQGMQILSERIRTEVFCGYCGEHECCCDAVSQHLHLAR